MPNERSNALVRSCHNSFLISLLFAPEEFIDRKVKSMRWHPTRVTPIHYWKVITDDDFTQTKVLPESFASFLFVAQLSPMQNSTIMQTLSALITLPTLKNVFALPEGWKTKASMGPLVQTTRKILLHGIFPLTVIHVTMCGSSSCCSHRYHLHSYAPTDFAFALVSLSSKKLQHIQ